MINQLFTGSQTSRRFVTMPAAQAAVLIAGNPILVGKLGCVLLDTFQTNTGGSTCLFGGAFSLSVVGASDEASPPTGLAIGLGDQIYASGTLDATTNVTYNLTLNGDNSKTLFGYLDPQYGTKITSGTTNTQAGVLLTRGM